MEEKSQKRGIFSKDEKKEYMSGYIMESLDILTEQKCMESLHMRKMKDKIEVTFCSVTAQNQNAKGKVMNKFSNKTIMIINLMKIITVSDEAWNASVLFWHTNWNVI